MRALRPLLIFLEATDAALVRRFSETRRPHPLAHDRPVIEGIQRGARRALKPIRALADEIVDTSDADRPRAARRVHGDVARHARTRPAAGHASSASGSSTACPLEADLVFDVRFLPNPHFVPRLRPLTGRDRAVIGVHGEAPGDQRDGVAARGAAAVPDSAVRGRGQDAT